MAWFRIDNRLVHGQVIEAWLPHLGAGNLVVVNDALAKDDFQQQIVRLAIPGRIAVSFVPVSEARALYDRLEAGNAASLFLVAACYDVLGLVEQGICIPVLNVGNMHYAEGKKQICPHVALSAEDIRCLDALRKNGTRLDYRCIPTDMPVVEDW
jgi:PTS system mannose-specific IIB component